MQVLNWLILGSFSSIGLSVPPLFGHQVIDLSKLWKAKSFNISGEDASLELINLGQFLQYRSGVGPMREETPL